MWFFLFSYVERPLDSYPSILRCLLIGGGHDALVSIAAIPFWPTSQQNKLTTALGCQANHRSGAMDVC